MNPSTAEIALDIEEYLQYAYPQLFGSVPLLIIGLAALLAGGALLCMAVASLLRMKRIGALYMWRIVAAVFIVALAVIACLNPNDHGGWLGIVPLCLLAAAAVAGLLLRYRWGTYCAIAFVWAFLVPNEITGVMAIQIDYDASQLYSTVGQLGLFSAASYIVYHAVAVFIVAIFFTCLFLLLFRDNRDTVKHTRPDDYADEDTSDHLTAVVWIVAILIIIPVFIRANIPDYLVSGTAAISNNYVAYLKEYREDLSLHENAEWSDGFMSASEALYEANGRFLNLDPAKMQRTDIPLYIMYSEASFNQMVAMEDIADCIAQGASISEPASRFDASLREQEQALLTDLQYLGIGDIPTVAANYTYDSLIWYVRFIGLTAFGIVAIVLGVLFAILAVVVSRKTARLYEEELAELQAGELVRIAAEDQGDGARLIEGASDGTRSGIHDDGSAETPSSIPGAVPNDMLFVPSRDIVSTQKSADDEEALPKHFELKYVAIVLAVLALFAISIAAEVIPSMNDIEDAENNASFQTTVLETTYARPVDLALWLRSLREANPSSISQDDLQYGLGLIDDQLNGLNELENWDAYPEGSDEFVQEVKELINQERPLLQEIRSILEQGGIPSQELISQYTQLHYGDSADSMTENLKEYLLQYYIGFALSNID